MIGSDIFMLELQAFVIIQWLVRKWDIIRNSEASLKYFF